ncbi:MAG: outer membrane beta-barrel protein [Planctomycetes bacterium]|nr:outer membrane beta-barrel protein [Planctomycetota bacterium]
MRGAPTARRRTAHGLLMACAAFLGLATCAASAQADDASLLKGEFSLTTGVSDEAFEQDLGWFVRGEVDLPLRRFGGFGILGQLGISYSHSDTHFDTLTSAVLGTLQDRTVSLSTLTVDMGFKVRYDELSGRDSSLRPYVSTGVGIPVYIVDPDRVVAGQVPEAQELREAGFPVGHGNIRVGPYLGGGLELMLGAGFILGVDIRHHFIGGKNSDFTHYGVTVGLDF